MEPEVSEIVVHYMNVEYGNPGSRTHEYGAIAKRAVEKARKQIAEVVASQPEEIIFTSGATESCNLATLGLEKWARKSGKFHIISSKIEHPAVLGPLAELEKRGFEITYVSCGQNGQVDPKEIEKSLRNDTTLISLMQVNNETGIKQPIHEICKLLESHPVFLHIDAAQGFGKEFESLRNPRIDLISASAHKIFAPKGIGILVSRRRGYDRIPLSPLQFGGGQERGFRAGTLPVALIAGFGEAARISLRDGKKRKSQCQKSRKSILDFFEQYQCQLHGDPALSMEHVLNFSLPSIDSEAFILQTKGIISASNGSACTSQKHQPSHVLTAMGLSDEMIAGAIRLSWCHQTASIDFQALKNSLASFDFASR